MSLLNVSKISFHYPSTANLFEDLSFAIEPDDRLALVGPNGAGKSSLLKLLAGELHPAAGAIIRRRGLRVASVDQQIDAHRGARQTTLFDFVRAVHTDPEDFAADARTERILMGLGFALPEMQLTLEQLSGGQRTRALLARGLAASSDILLLDEPTNHLDIAGREWLENELATRRSACVVVSHDRKLLESVATGVVEIVRGKARVFPGSYHDFLERRALLERQAWHEYNGYERRKAADEQAAERRAKLAVRVGTPPPGEKTSRDFYGRKASKVARTARMLKERITEAEVVNKPWIEQPMPDLDFSCVRRSGDVVLVARQLAKSYGEKHLFGDLTFQLARGDRLAIAGPNGAGKTTLLRILMGEENPDAGDVRLGANVQIGYLAQDAEPLDLDASPLEICGTTTLARALLAGLKIRPDRVARPVRELSPGERAKVALARLLVSGANLLLLDEPTNHLEVEAQQAIESALLRFPGAVVIVSHDRRFLEGLQPKILELQTPREPTTSHTLHK